ncbi:MAG: gliding motility-associated C-terminal domain-containing protein [Haliscomenobacter sp.]|uniref:T9SS type B sorting domain-containing protein n=1 Tax=Haliscomenobacter sp. TaxID=2717303 RepID=UPI0029A384CA|nr:gliding motility-associated C-terminal domain-containing protein [Haliscomenobacter sp.]MDX2070342.1 gliding motility-associated C-terminal domain-containing protein [Haliscomenobacter sp.]
MRKSQILLFALLFWCSSTLLAQVACPTVNPITVTRTTGGTGVNGSLPWAINCMNNVSALNIIQFNITGAGPHIIQPITNAPFPTVTKANAHIDGSTDNIVIDGSLGQGQGLVLAANNVKVNGLTLRNFATANFANGLTLSTGNGHDISSCQIFDNLVGISVARSVGSFTISNNYIGVDKSGNNLSNTNVGIDVETFAGTTGTPTGTISNNFIAYSSNGIEVGTARNVIISRNSIFCNTKIGIERLATITTPSISNATTTQVTGTAPAGSTVEVFKVNNSNCPNAPCQGGTFIGSVTTNTFGSWNLTITSGLSAGDLVTATMTQSSNTSEFSACRTVADVCANFSASIKSSNVTCNGGTNGSATVSTSGGLNQGITFSWSNGATTATISNLKAGTYTVTASDAAGCRSIQSVNILQPTAIVITPSSVNVACNGEKSGLINAAVTGGVGPYTYRWSNGATTSAITSLVAGAYTLTVTDQNNCTKTASVTLTQPSAINLLLNGNDTVCPGAKNGTAQATVTGGISPYSYIWSTGATTSSISNLGPGNYLVTISDQNKCQKTGTISVIETPTLKIDSNVVQPKCVGEANGSIELKISGGISPYTFFWENGATTANRTNLAAGDYKVAVTDANRCSETRIFTLKDPSPISAKVNTTDPACFGQNNGTATVTVGSPGTHTFLWSTSATTSSISNLSAGRYNLTVTNVSGCKATFPFVLNAPSAGLAITTKSINIDCFGQKTGLITTNTTGGKAPYAYNWSNGSTQAELFNLPAGTYGVTVTDQSGCGDTAMVKILENPAISTKISSNNPACFGQNNGQASVTVGGGSPAYTYIWSTGATTSSISNLAAGKYVLTVTDALLCTQKDSIVLIAPTQLQVNATATNVNCNGTATGSAQVIAVGGTVPYSYAWSNGATTSAISNLAANTYGVTVSDSRACQVNTSVSVTQPTALVLVLNTSDIPCNETNTGRATAQVSGGTSPYRYAWSNGATTSALSNLAPGDFGLTVTDAAGCVVNDSKRVNTTARINPQINTTNILCNGQSNGQASVTFTGTGVHLFNWSNGATTSAINNLAAGTYSVTVTNSANCKESASATITVPPALTLSIVPTNLRCNGQNQGQALATAGGGVAPYAYRWSNGATSSSITALAAGNYSLTITDANQCTRAQNMSITEPSALQANATFTRETSPNARNGTATATASGGTGPYRFTWNTGATTAAITGLASGVYTVTVEDANGCSVVRSGAVSGDNCTGLSVSGIATDLGCAGAESGSISLTVVGGTMPYFYAWSNGQTSANLTELNEGTYSVTVIDANGCTGNYSATLKAGSRMPKPLYGIVAPDTVCGNETFTLRADDLFQGPNVLYIWQLPNGEELTSTTPSLKLKANSSTFSGEYSALRDSAGCRSSVFGPVIVDVVSLPPNSFSAGRDTTLCQGNSITLKAQAPQSGKATWFDLSTRTSIQNANSPNATAQNLQIGANRFVWRIAIGKCIQAASDTVTVFLEKGPQLVDDKYTIERAQDIAAMNILLNDNLTGLQDTSISWSGAPSMGVFEYVPGNKSFRYTAESDFRGVLTFTYTVCNEASKCASPCDSAMVTMEVFNLPKPTEGMVLEDPGPNGTLQIRGLQGFSSVDIVITNRWGDIVYRNNDYDNDAPWRGRSGDNGPFLPPGAYYYVIRAYDDGKLVGKPQTGAIYLFKKENP